MKKAIGAVVYHCSEASNAEARYLFCSKEPNTWCKYQAAKIHGTVYTDKPSLPKVLHVALMSTFQELSDDTILKRCVHGFTQNNNEPSHSWHRWTF